MLRSLVGSEMCIRDRNKIKKTKIFYERECSNKEGPIYDFEEMRRLLQEIEPSLKGFFDQLYLAARLFERNGPYEEINGGVHVLSSSCFIK